MKNIFLLLGIALAVSCNQRPEHAFSLSGTTTGLEDGSMIYLKTNDDKLLDSTEVWNNIFVFESDLVHAPVKAELYLERGFPYREIYLERSAMNFDMGEAGFSDAVVTGSGEEALNHELWQQVKDLPVKEGKEAYKEFIKKHPNSLVSAHALRGFSLGWGKKTTQELFEAFSEEVKASPDGQMIARYLELNQQPEPGDYYADFTMPDADGNPVRLSEFEGKIILLEFWAAWCRPCREENPNLVKNYEKYYAKGFEIIGVSLDTNREYWLKAVEADGLLWPQVNDLSGWTNEASQTYGVYKVPSNFLIGRDGKVLALNVRGEELSEELASLMPELIASSEQPQ